MSSLTQRFREVEVALEGAAPRVSEWPASWLRVEQSSTLVRFVDAQFEKERTMAVSGVCSARGGRLT